MATYRVRSGGKEYTVTVVDAPAGGATVTVDGQSFEVELASRPHAASPAPSTTGGRRPAPVAVAAPQPRPAAGDAGPGSILAPIPGKIVVVCVAVGDSVSVNQVVLKIEAMKMENEIMTPVAGTVQEIKVREGAEANEGQLLMVIG